MDKPAPDTPRSRRAAEVATGPSLLSPGRFAPKERERLGGPGLRTFAAIAELWGLSETQRLHVLGFPGRSTYHHWLGKARERKRLLLPVDSLLRISAVLGIYKALQILFAREEDEKAWLTKPHDAPAFGGQPPLA